MKKFYTFLAASAVVFSAMAVEGTDASVQLLSRTGKKTVNVKDVPAFPLAVDYAPVNNSVRGLRKANTDPIPVEGFWTFMLGDYYTSTGSGGPIYVTFEASLEDDKITFTPAETANNSQYQVFDLQGIYDEENNTITFKREFYGIVKASAGAGNDPIEYYVYQDPFVYYDLTNTWEYIDEFSCEFDEELNCWVFPINTGIDWAAYETMDSEESENTFGQYDLIFAWQFDGVSANEGTWQDIGMASFMDGWLVPAMGLKQETNLYDVEIQQNVEIPTRYRLVNPYKSGPVAKYNGYEGDGYIVFDIADQEHVLFLPSDAGFLNYAIQEGGIFNFYAYNYLGHLAAAYPDYTVEEIIQGSQGIPYTVYNSARNVVSLTSSNGMGETVYDANFGTQLNPYGGGIWSNPNGSKVNMNAAIYFPEGYNAEVGSIVVDEDGPAEYFNLQGMRVVSPEAGQIVIKRQNGKSSKLIIR